MSSHTHWECDTLVLPPSYSHTCRRSFCEVSHSFCLRIATLTFSLAFSWQEIPNDLTVTVPRSSNRKGSAKYGPEGFERGFHCIHVTDFCLDLENVHDTIAYEITGQLKLMQSICSTGKSHSFTSLELDSPVCTSLNK